MSYENPNNDFHFPQLSLPSPLGNTFNNYSSLGQEMNFSQNSFEFTTNAFENGALAPHETPSFISEPVDDYSLNYIFSMGRQYCANLKEKNYIRSEEGNPSSEYMNPTVPMLVEQGNPNPTEFNGYVGGTVQSPVEAKSSTTYSDISRYMGNLEKFLRESPRPQQIEGGFMGVDESVWTQTTPKYYNDELKEVTKDEYLISLQSKKSKNISSHGASTLPMSNSENNKYKSILWSAQVYRDTQAWNNQSIDSNGVQYRKQTSIVTSGFYSTGMQQGGENGEFGANPGFNLGNGSGMKIANVMEKGMSIGEGSRIILDNEEDYSTIWQDLNPLPPIFEDEDCYILQDSQNKDFQNHDHQNISCTNQVMDIGSGWKFGENSSDDFVKSLITSEGNPNPPQSTIEEYVNISTMGGSVEGQEFLKQDQNEFSFASEYWTDDRFWLTTRVLRDYN